MVERHQNREMDTPENMSPASPSLGLTLQAETAALRNDLDQATHLAAEYQRRLSSKNNDFAALKMTLEKALADLDAMQNTIGELRAERHRFANEAMRAIALERRLQKVAAERDLFRAELEEYRRRCTCDGSGASQPAPVPVRPAEPAPAPKPSAKDSLYTAPERSGQKGVPRAFIPMPFDDPEDPTDVTFNT